MEIKADEITKIIREQIEEYRGGVDVSEVGNVISVGDGIARVYGLEKAMAGELLEFPRGVMGLALNLEESQVGVVLLGDLAHDLGFDRVIELQTWESFSHGNWKVTLTPSKHWGARTLEKAETWVPRYAGMT